MSRQGDKDRMDTYFFDNPPKAIMKGTFLLITYIGSILFKQFTVDVVLPTVLLYFLSNMSDYAELAFMKEDKVKKIRYWSLGIFVAMLLMAVLVFCVHTTGNTYVLTIVNRWYVVFYALCSVVWFIPFFDGIRGQCDKIRSSSVVTEQFFHSERAYNVMSEGTMNIGDDELRKKT